MHARIRYNELKNAYQREKRVETFLSICYNGADIIKNNMGLNALWEAAV